MNKHEIFKTGTMILLTFVFSSILITACSKAPAIETEKDDISTKTSIAYSLTDIPVTPAEIAAFPFEELSTEEIAALTFMREEEYLAHDVYYKLYQKYHKPIFNNIKKSELVHTNAIKALLVKYNLPDPAVNHVTGVFSDPTMQNLYNTLIAQGYISMMNGLVVGATIEDLDIFDLNNHLLEVDNQDILFTFNNLRRGSCNHMRAFYANIKAFGGSYTPQYISQEEFDEIIYGK